MEVCFVSENAYPVGRGGVSEWCRSIIEGMDDVVFNIVTISPEGKLRYELPENVDESLIVTLNSPRFMKKQLGGSAEGLLGALEPALRGGASRLL